MNVRASIGNSSTFNSLVIVLKQAVFVAALTVLAPIVLVGPSHALASINPNQVAPSPAPIPASQSSLSPAPALGPVQDSATQPVLRFIPSAVGTLARGADLQSTPVGGSVVAELPAGTRVSIGGKVAVPAGILPRYAYWIRVEATGGEGTGGEGTGSPVLGFLQERSVIVTAGVISELDLAGLTQSVLLGGEIGSTDADLNVGAAVLAAVPAAVPGAVAWLPSTVTRWLPAIEAAAKRHGVDPALVAIVVLVESGGNPSAVSPSGAVGLMQIMPGTALDIAARRGLESLPSAAMYHPETNLDFGAWYLADMLRAFGVNDSPGWQQSVELAAAAYNGGPGHVGQHLTTGQPLYAESARYRAWVGGMWNERTQAGSATLNAWLLAGGQRLVDAARDVTVAF